MRREYVPLNQLLAEINQKLKTGCSPDYITLAGSGEPTLYAKIGELIDKLKKRTKKPVAVITNGSLLWDPAVQDALLQADLVIPSLDAGDADTFGYVNRPHGKIHFDKMVDGLIGFRKKYHKKLWLEVFLLSGITAIDAEVIKIAAISKEIAPDKIQLNTVARPPAEVFAVPVNELQMTKFAKRFGKNTEIIINFRRHTRLSGFTASSADVLNLISRRPCSLYDIANGLSIAHNEAVKILGHLEGKNLIETHLKGNSTFYVSAK